LASAPTTAVFSVVNTPFDPAVLRIAAGVLSLTAMLASYLPAGHATRIVPLDALRSE
jgi:ABC-type antimicrobial peptide transport system permease subunit